MTQRDWLLVGGGVIAGIALAVGIPAARRQLGPIIAETGERAGGLLSGLAEMVANQMEKVEDMAAAQKSQPSEST